MHAPHPSVSPPLTLSTNALLLGRANHKSRPRNWLHVTFQHRFFTQTLGLIAPPLGVACQAKVVQFCDPPFDTLINWVYSEPSQTNITVQHDGNLRHWLV